MKKITSPLIISACLLFNVSSFAGDDSGVTALQNQLFKLQASQENTEKQFKNAYKEIKKVESQLPKINEDFQAQLKKMQDNNNKMMKEVQTNNEAQLKALTDQLNTLKERLSKKPVNQEG